MCLTPAQALGAALGLLLSIPVFKLYLMFCEWRKNRAIERDRRKIGV
jgi:hypothetical protein